MSETNNHLDALDKRIKTLKAIRRIVEKNPNQEKLGLAIKNLERIADKNHLSTEDLTYLVQEGYLDPKDASLPTYLIIGNDLDTVVDCDFA